MAAQRILIFLLSCPLLVLAWFSFHFSRRVQLDLKKCLMRVDQLTFTPSRELIRALVLAEDHRNSIHFGVDPIGILRALFIFASKRQIQGASTIEQQFVRTVTGKRERTFRRKIQEQMTAINLCFFRDKEQVAAAYLDSAHYGAGFKGVFSFRYQPTNFKRALWIVSHLKYPRPMHPNTIWYQKLEMRVSYLVAISPNTKAHAKLNPTLFKQAYNMKLKSHIACAWTKHLRSKC